MEIRYSKESDVNISLASEEKANSSAFVRKEIAARLFSLVENGSLVNVRRSLAACPVCKSYCTYIPESEKVARNFAKSTILDQRDGFEITIPVELIHILSDHPEVDVDVNLFECYS
jgi:hypothetical protein